MRFRVIVRTEEAAEAAVTAETAELDDIPDEALIAFL